MSNPMPVNLNDVYTRTFLVFVTWWFDNLCRYRSWTRQVAALSFFTPWGWWWSRWVWWQCLWIFRFVIFFILNLYIKLRMSRDILFPMSIGLLSFGFVTYSSCLNKLRILQKKAIRIITQSHYLAHTDPLFSKLKLLKLDDLYKHQLGIYMYKSTKGLLPDSMSSMVIPIHNVHNHNLRNQNAYYIQHVRTNCRKFTIHYTGPIFWNTLPQQLREAVSENQFKRKLK